MSNAQNAFEDNFQESGMAQYRIILAKLSMFNMQYFSTQDVKWEI